MPASHKPRTLTVAWRRSTHSGSAASWVNTPNQPKTTCASALTWALFTSANPHPPGRPRNSQQEEQVTSTVGILYLRKELTKQLYSSRSSKRYFNSVKGHTFLSGRGMMTEWSVGSQYPRLKSYPWNLPKSNKELNTKTHTPSPRWEDIWAPKETQVKVRQRRCELTPIYSWVLWDTQTAPGYQPTVTFSEWPGQMCRAASRSTGRMEWVTPWASHMEGTPEAEARGRQNQQENQGQASSKS